MKKRILGVITLLYGLGQVATAQPAITPAPGYVWQMVSTSTYATGPQRTGCTGACSTNNSSFGLQIECPPDLPSTTVPGCPVIQKQIFGNIGESGANRSSLAVSQNPGCGGTTAGGNWPASSTATRRITLTEWTNPNPASVISNGAMTGTVCIPTAARILIDDGAVCDGSGVGADELRFLVIGGNSGAQSSFNITANYQLSWSSSQYGGSGSTGMQTVTQNLVVFDAGNGNNYDWAMQQPNQSWYYPSVGTNVASFGTSLQQTFSVPAASINQSGGSFTIDFTATASVDLSRGPGNADARVSMGPGFHGRARYEVDYQCWQIVQNPMPVQLVSFNGKMGDGVINLQWETAAEQNNSHFDIERSTDAKSFEAIGRNAGKGTVTSTQYYTFSDESPAKGINYYRLRQVDLDGKVTLSKIIAVLYDERQPLLELLGNPTEKHAIRIRLKNASPENLRFSTLVGQPISFDLQLESDSVYRLYPQNTLTRGVYVFSLQEGTVQISERLVIH
ncbi:hypothetical protein [Spirosoma harenae]